MVVMGRMKWEQMTMPKKMTMRECKGRKASLVRGIECGELPGVRLMVLQPAHWMGGMVVARCSLPLHAGLAPGWRDELLLLLSVRPVTMMIEGWLGERYRRVYPVMIGMTLPLHEFVLLVPRRERECRRDVLTPLLPL